MLSVIFSIFRLSNLFSPVLSCRKVQSLTRSHSFKAPCGSRHGPKKWNVPRTFGPPTSGVREETEIRSWLLWLVSILCPARLDHVTLSFSLKRTVRIP